MVEQSKPPEEVTVSFRAWVLHHNNDYTGSVTVQPLAPGGPLPYSTLIPGEAIRPTERGELPQPGSVYWMRGLHADWHEQRGNMLGRDECGYEHCEFWDAADFALTAYKQATRDYDAEPEPGCFP